MIKISMLILKKQLKIVKK